MRTIYPHGTGAGCFRGSSTNYWKGKTCVFLCCYSDPMVKVFFFSFFSFLTQHTQSEFQFQLLKRNPERNQKEFRKKRYTRVTQWAKETRTQKTNILRKRREKKKKKVFPYHWYAKLLKETLSTISGSLFHFTQYVGCPLSYCLAFLFLFKRKDIILKAFKKIRDSLKSATAI